MPEEIKTKGLGKISGLCAVYTESTMNGRNYNEIYRKMLAGEDYRFSEMMRRGGILCEFGHPSQYAADFERTETDPEKACAIITKMEEKEHGKVYAEGVILDTPAGRVFKAIEPFYKFGFSSRGSYEVDENSTEGPMGWNQDTYVFKGFDIVALPATEGSELSYSATESLNGKRRKVKSAREALDLQHIADASNVDPSEVDAELDKLFARDGSLAPAELVTLDDLREDGEDLTSTDGKTPDSSKNRGDIICDLRSALAKNHDLQSQVQNLLFQKQQSEAESTNLRLKISELEATLSNAQDQLAFYEKNKAEIQELLDKLVKTHEGAMQEADAQYSELNDQLAAEQQKTQSLASQVAQLQAEAAQANEEATAKQDSLASQLSQANEALAAEHRKVVLYAKTLKAAREDWLTTYSNIYSISRSALESAVGTKVDARSIRLAAESLSGRAARLSGLGTTIQPARIVSQREPDSFTPQDDVDRELFDAIKKEQGKR